MTSLKREENFDTCYNVKESEVVKLSEKASHKKANIVRFHLYEVPGVVKFIETEGRMVVANI